MQHQIPLSRKTHYVVGLFVLFIMACDILSQPALPISQTESSTPIQELPLTSKPPDEQTTIPAPYSTPAFMPSLIPLNAIKQAGNFTIAVLGWGLTKGSGEATAAAGHDLLVADVVLWNQSNELVDLFSTFHLSLKDASANIYEIIPVYFTRELEGGLSGYLAPGEHGRHRYFFSVPENSQGLTLLFSPCERLELCKSDAISIPLDKPASISPLPVELTSLDPGTHTSKELITSGEISLSLVRWRRLSESEREADPNLIGPEGPILPGMDLVILDLLLSNQTNQAFTFNQTVVGLKDTSGTYYRIDREGYGSRWIEDYVWLLPGEWAYVRSFFQVEPYPTRLVMYVDYGPYGDSTTNRTFLDLGDEPIAFEVPVQVPGEVAPHAIAKGQPVKIGAYEVTLTDFSFPSTSEWADSASSGGCAALEEGVIGIEVTYTLKNIGAQPIYPSGIISHLKNGTGRYYRGCGNAYSTVYVEDFSPGETVTVKTAFLIINESTTDLWLVLEDINATQFNNGEKTFYSLK